MRRFLAPLMVAIVATLALLQPAACFQIFPKGSLMRREAPPTTEKDPQQQQQHALQTTLGIPNGLMETLVKNNAAFSKRIWVVDNSGSMKLGDGHQILDKGDCTRWNELEETVLLHARLSAALQQPTEFRMLNGDPKRSFTVGHNTLFGNKGLKQAEKVLANTSPSGNSPLSESIAGIRSEIVRQLPQLRADGGRVAIVIVTDGCNYSLETVGKPEKEVHQELVEALESLRGLPVSVVVRLCTDYGPIVDLYNELDERFDGLDVLDDYYAEALEVYQHNPWLNYALVLHRMREMGQYSQLFDWLDEKTLTREELREFCGLLFGTHHEFPDPHNDWKGFLQAVNKVQQQEKLQFNPRTQEMAPWIDVEFLAMLE